MDILPLIEKLSNDFNEKFNTEINVYELEETIKNIGDNFTTSLLVSYLEYLDTNFMLSEKRKEKYKVKEILEKSILTKIGWITFKYRVYIDKETNERYPFLRKVLHLKPYQRITDEAEYEIIKYAKENNMAQASRYAIRNTQISRSTVSKKIKNLKGSVNPKIKRVTDTPKVLFIEMDEIHANLQLDKNHICPCAIVHEGYKEDFTKRKVLKNVKNFASAELSYKELWEVIYDYVNKKYDLDKIDYLFISGDGASGIKDFSTVFPKGIFVLDPFHYKVKALSYIFKTNNKLKNLADTYLREDKIDDFKLLVQSQIELHPNQEVKMIQKQNYILNNLEGIKNQKHFMYTCPCSMESHVSNRYARYITSVPYAFSLQGLENKLKLLVLNADNYNLTFEDFLNLKYGENHYKTINENIDKIVNIKFDSSLTKNLNTSTTIDISAPIPIFDNPLTQDYCNRLVAFKKL